MQNFGENVTFSPRHVYTPRAEGELLAILDRHAGGTVRVAGALHSWSDAVATDDVLIDLRHFDHVAVESDAHGERSVIAGGGCTLERLVAQLRTAGATLPTIGAVMKQTVAGAIATGTHGSGGPSLSHYVEAVRLAAYDPVTGRARIYEIAGGESLRAARCALGCMGVVLSARLRIRREFWVTATISHHDTLDAVLARREEWPLQQFTLFPYAWTYVAFNRREADGAPGTLARLAAAAYRYYDQLALELVPHQLLSKVLLRASKGGRPSWLVRRFLQHVAPRLFRAPATTLPSMTALTLHTKRHASVQHVEMELFIPEARLDYGVRLLRALVEWSAGTADAVPASLRADLDGCGLGPELDAARGRYMQHYPLFFRRVRADDTLVSMTSDGRDCYSASVFTYLPEAQRERYYAFCALVARALVRLADARLHWGKYFPLAAEDVAHLYPGLAEFRDRCAAVDPAGTFVNDYARRVLGMTVRAGGAEPTPGA